MSMYPLSNLMKEKDTGNLVLISDLLQGTKTVVTDSELKGYDMYPISGTIKNIDGEILDLVELIENAGGNGGTGEGGNWKPSFNKLEKKHNEDVKKIEEEIEAVKEKHELDMNQTNANVEEIKLKCEKDIKDLELTLKELTLKHNNDILKLRTKDEDLEKQIVIVNNEVTSLKAVIDSLRENDIELQKGIDNLKKEVENNYNDLDGKIKNIKIAEVMVYKGIYETKEIMIEQLKNPVEGWTALVGKSDEDKVMYIFNGTSWENFGKFDFKVRDFVKEPINLTTEVTGKLDIKNLNEEQLRDKFSSVLLEEKF